MKYIVRNKVVNKIRTFYKNVAKKYKHVYSEELMQKNIADAITAMSQIENGLMSREPTISCWKGLHMATSKDKKWNFAYEVKNDTIYIIDVCHAQNMHESENILPLMECYYNYLRKLLNY